MAEAEPRTPFDREAIERRDSDSAGATNPYLAAAVEAAVNHPQLRVIRQDLTKKNAPGGSGRFRARP
jgi:hypothetical protein